MRIQGSQKLHNEWCGECEVACRDKHACNDKFESKEHRVVSTCVQEQAEIISDIE